MGLLIGWRQVYITVKHCGTFASNHSEVSIFYESELLYLLTCNVVCTAFLTVNVIKLVASKIMGIIYRHLESLKIKPKDAVLLRLVLHVVLPREKRMLKLPFVVFYPIFVHFFSQKTIVRKLVIIDRSYTAIDIKKGTVGAEELCSCDNVSLDEKSCILN